MNVFGLVPLAPYSAANSFWQQAALNAVGPIVAALFGGVVVGLVVQRAQDRRAKLTLRTTLSFEMMQVAYAFYYRSEEVIRRERYGQEWDAAVLHRQYEDFRTAARVLEAKLHAYFPDEVARWLWHGVIDYLAIRYYGLVHKGERFDGMIARHGKHPHEVQIPAAVRSLFLGPDELRDDEVVVDRVDVVAG